MGLLSWWKREPVYSEIGIKLWELMRNVEGWETEAYNSIKHPGTRLRLTTHTHSYLVGVPRGVQVGVIGDIELPSSSFTPDEHERLFVRVHELSEQITTRRLQKRLEAAEKEIRSVLGLK